MGRWGARIVATVAALLALAAAPAAAQRAGPPGRFDYYLLDLSWSPEYCARRGDLPSAAMQCAGSRRYGFIAHGLWPQFEDGNWPLACRPGERLPDEVVRSMLPLMPGEGLVRHEWKAHGSCTALAPDRYFALVASAFARLRIPPAFADPARPPRLDAASLRALFLDANPGLPPDGFALVCRRDGRTLRELRFCLDKRAGFRHCGARVADSCRGRLWIVPLAPNDD